MKFYVPVHPVKKWGIELEGGWKYPRGFDPYSDEPEYAYRTLIPSSIRSALHYTWKVTSDGSIDSDDGVPAELVVNPPAARLALLKEDIGALWPRLVDVNDSMGCHIHVSFGRRNRELYDLLTSWSFAKRFQDWVAVAFPEVGERLENHFCRRYETGSEFRRTFPGQLNTRYKDEIRYRSINYPYRIHGSIEFRVFPMHDDKRRVWGYLDFVEKSIHRYLNMVSSGQVKPILGFKEATN